MENSKIGSRLEQQSFIEHHGYDSYIISIWTGTKIEGGQTREQNQDNFDLLKVT